MNIKFACLQCGADLEPLRYSDLFDMYYTECEKCQVDYRVLTEAPMIVECHGFQEVTKTVSHFYRHGFTEFREQLPLFEDYSELEFNIYLLWRAEKLGHNTVNELTEKIKRLEQIET